MVYLLILILAFVTQTSTLDLQSFFDNFPEGDAVLISELESELFGCVLCGDDTISPWGSCQLSMEDFGLLLDYNNGPAFYPLNVSYGSFTGVGAQEVIVGLALEGTDTGAISHTLLRRDGATWEPVQFIEDALLQAYLTFPASEGHTIFVARQDRVPIGGLFESYMSGFTLQAVDVTEGTETSLLLDFVNPLLSCTHPPAPGARYVEINDWKRQDVNEDGYLDLVVEVGETELSTFECGERGELLTDPRQSEPVVQQVTFLFNGQTFQPTPEAQRLKRFSQAEQGGARD